jgi:hypothetical protein
VALVKVNREPSANASQATFAIGFFDELRRRIGARTGPASGL